MRTLKESYKEIERKEKEINEASVNKAETISILLSFMIVFFVFL